MMELLFVFSPTTCLSRQEVLLFLKDFQNKVYPQLDECRFTPETVYIFKIGSAL